MRSDFLIKDPRLASPKLNHSTKESGTNLLRNVRSLSGPLAQLPSKWKLQLRLFGQEPFQEAYSTSSMGISSHRTETLLFIHQLQVYQHSDSVNSSAAKL